MKIENKTPRISLIVAFYNKIECLRLIFAALERQTFSDFEVVIADDGSRDEVVKELQGLIGECPFPVRHVWHEDKGWSKNVILNKAVAAACAELLLFIDGDCIPNRHFVEDHIYCARRGEVSTGRRVMLTPRTTAMLSVGNVGKRWFDMMLFFPLLLDTLLGHKTEMEQMFRVKPMWLRRCLIKENERFILGCNFSMYKSDLMLVDGFDERFVNPGYGEDIDLGNRLSKVGVKCMSRRRLMVIYHMYHEHFFMDHPDSLALLESNRRSSSGSWRNSVSINPNNIGGTP